MNANAMWQRKYETLWAGLAGYIYTDLRASGRKRVHIS